MHITRASNGLVKLSLFVHGAAQKLPFQLTAVAGVMPRLQLALSIRITMKRIIFLTLLLVSLSCYSQSKNDTKSYVGTYGYSSQELIIYPATNSTVVIYMDINGGPPYYTGGSFYGTATLKEGYLQHSSTWRDYEGRTCEFTISVEDQVVAEKDMKAAKVKFVGNHSKCGSSFLRRPFHGIYFKSTDTPKSVVENHFEEDTCSLKGLAQMTKEGKLFKVSSNEECSLILKTINIENKA